MQRFLWSALAASIVLMASIVATADDDQFTAQQVTNNFKGNLKGYNVEVKVQDGTAWLNGTVADPRQMAMAATIAKQTNGVARVVNNLAIGSAASPPAGSRQLGNDVIGGNRQYADEGQSAQPRPMTNRPRMVVPAGMELPDHARQELMVANSMPGADDDAGPSYDDPNAGYARQAVAQSYANQPRRNAGYGPNSAAYGQSGMAAGQTGPNVMRQVNQPMPLPIGGGNQGPYRQVAAMNNGEMMGAPQPLPDGVAMGQGGPAPYRYDHAQMPNYAWPSYAASPNYAAVTYPKQYSPTAWPYIGPFYPYPQVPLGWRKVALEWKDGWWNLDFQDSH